MACLLPADCLNIVFENLEDDKGTLHSCLLVNRLWCKVSVRILWRSFPYCDTHYRQSKVALSILSTLISCLPNKSKELLHKNEIFIPTLISKPPLFNYVSFCKVLSIDEIYQIIDWTLSDTKNFKDKSWLLISKEMFKMFMDQVFSLKMLTYYLNNNNIHIPDYIPFTSFPGAIDCLTDLSELHCCSCIHSEFFYGLSQICHNLRSLIINFEGEGEVSDELKELVSSQNNLKNLKLSAYSKNGLADIIPALIKHSNTLTKLHLHGDQLTPLSSVSSFLNLQKIIFNGIHFNDFKKLQNFTFPKLQTLKITLQCSEPEYLTKFLEINGKNLKKLYLNSNITKNITNYIAKFCPNLKKLDILFSNDDKLYMLKIIFNGCQYLEGIVIWCGGVYMNEGKVLEIIAKHSSKNFHEIKLHSPKLFLKDLESFLISWKNRESKKSISLIVFKYFHDTLGIYKDSMIIEKYKNLGVIKKFEIRIFW